MKSTGVRGCLVGSSVAHASWCTLLVTLYLGRGAARPPLHLHSVTGGATPRGRRRSTACTTPPPSSMRFRRRPRSFAITARTPGGMAGTSGGERCDTRLECHIWPAQRPESEPALAIASAEGTLRLVLPVHTCVGHPRLRDPWRRARRATQRNAACECACAAQPTGVSEKGEAVTNTHVVRTRGNRAPG